MTTPSPIEQERALISSHLNLKWSIADIERIAALVATRNSASNIANVMGCSPGEILDVCRRNGFALGRL